jgi:hypothetical protein
MSHEKTPALEDAMNAAFDTALSQHFHSEAEPDDDGFSQRVMAALPERALPRRIRWAELAQHAQWTAISVAACGAAVLPPIGDGRLDVAHTVAAYTLIGWLVFWSIPSRWSRG